MRLPGGIRSGGGAGHGILESVKDENHGVVADGHALAQAAWLPHVEYEVRSRYVRELAGAPPNERRRIERIIAREIRERLDEVAPPGAFY